MENLINKLPDILKNAGSLFGVCALVAIVIGMYYLEDLYVNE